MLKIPPYRARNGSIVLEQYAVTWPPFTPAPSTGPAARLCRALAPHVEAARKRSGAVLLDAEAWEDLGAALNAALGQHAAFRALPSGFHAPAVEYVGRGRWRVSWGVYVPSHGRKPLLLDAEGPTWPGVWERGYTVALGPLLDAFSGPGGVVGPVGRHTLARVGDKYLVIGDYGPAAPPEDSV